MEEVTGTVMQNADNVRQANQLSSSAFEVAARDSKMVMQVVATMGSITESSRRIADITGVIDGVAFQTNILALDTAVKAARAGEQDRGFVVVASEVRSLAQRSATAAREIKELINDSVEKANAGAKLVDQTGATMDEIVIWSSAWKLSEIAERVPKQALTSPASPSSGKSPAAVVSLPVSLPPSTTRTASSNAPVFPRAVPVA
jgi:methyl-accepting chemotaxis protein